MRWEVAAAGVVVVVGAEEADAVMVMVVSSIAR